LKSVVGSDDAKADLRTGTLRASATSQTLNDGVNLLREGGAASATLYDTITILNIPMNQTKQIEVRMTVHGGFTLDPASPFGAGGVMSNSLRGFTDSGLFGATGIRIISGNAGTAVVDSTSSLGTAGTTNGSINGTFADGTEVDAVSSVFFNATNLAPTFSFTSALFVNSAVGFGDVSPDPRTAVVDFGNTARLELILPDGVTFSSASGVFLQGVPEPASFSLVAAAMAALFLRLRRG